MDDVLSTERQAASTKIDTLRQGFEFEQRMNHRAFAEQQNELIRGYDKRLADQKTDFAHVMDETKNGYDKKLRESERRQQTALEDQARAYEQRIVQMEATISERDRKSAAFHADEMDKMRRSHELSTKKKS
jgi:hypothetical protein